MATETLAQRQLRLEGELKTAVIARRRYFLLACTCCDLADPTAKLVEKAFSQTDAALLDEGLEKFHEACELVSSIRRELSDVRRMQRISDNLGVKV